MPDEFYRFPRTPHIKWLGDGVPRGDKLLSEGDAEQMLLSELTAEEKIDGANVGLSVAQDGMLRAQNRGAWIERDAGGQFKHLWSWVLRYELDLTRFLGTDLILFGEWCYARHSVAYQSLPDWFIGFDVYDRRAGRFYSIQKRDVFLSKLGIQAIKPLAKGHLSLETLVQLLEESSRYGAKNLEGIYLRRDCGDWLVKRAKLVRRDFAQAITEHWSRKGIIPNQVDYTASSLRM